MMYDAILIGKDIGSLIAAVAVTCRGSSALFLRDGEALDVHAASGCSFNIDPFPWAGLASSDSFLHAHLPPAILQAVLPLLVPLNPGLQVILPDHRLDIFSGLEPLMHETGREFPGSEGKLAAFYDGVSRANRLLTEAVIEYPALRPGTLKRTAGFLKRMALYLREKSRCDRIARGMRDDSLRVLFETQLAVLSHLHPAGLKHSPAWPHVLFLPLQGVFYPLGGKKAAWDSLEDLFVRQGGVLLKGCTIERISARTGFYQIEGRAGQETLQAASRHLVVSRAWKNMDRLVQADGRKSRRFEAHLGRSEERLHPFTIYMSVFDRGLPEKMAEYAALITDPRRPLQDLNFIFVELSRRGDSGRAPEGKRAMSATVFLDKSPSRFQDGELSGLADQLLERLNDFLPFLSENVDFLDIGQCIDLSRQCEETAARRYRIVRPSRFRLSALSSKTPLKNVYMTGKDVFASLGFQGELLSGLNAANLSTGGPL